MSEIFESFSNYGEDAVLHGLMKRLSQITGENLFSLNTYIDLGCYDPIDGSNTYFLYKLGWSGTMVDANSMMISRGKLVRPNDKFYSYIVSDTSKKEKFYIFGNNLQCSTSDKSFADKIAASHNMEISTSIDIDSKTIDDLMLMHLANFDKVPLIMNIDIEGADLKAIKAYSFAYRPLFILIEDDILSVYSNSELNIFLAEKNYVPVTSNFLTTVFMDASSYYFSKLKNLGPIDLEETHENI